MTDTELEDRVRVALRAVAAATPTDAALSAPRRARWLAVAACVALVAGAGTLALTVDRDDETTTVADAPPGATAEPSALPAGFDPANANPFFAADGQAADVAVAYLRERFPDYPLPGVVVEPAVVDGLLVTIRWSTSGETEGVLAAGDLFLRQVDGRWAMVAATTDDIDLSGLVYDGKRVRGVVRTTGDETLFAEVRDWRGDFVRHAPERFGGDRGELEIDVSNPLAPTTVRVLQVGGTVLSIAEVRFEPQPLAAHRDYERCTVEHTNRDKEPTPDVVGRLCAHALDGDVIGSGAGGGPAWELVATTEPTGRWVTLRARDQIGTYRIQTDGEFDSLFTQLGPCCSFAEHVAIVGTLRRGTTGMRAVLADGTAIAGEGFEDPSNGVVHSVVLVPLRLIQNDAGADVEVRLADGTFEHAADMNLAILGG